MGNGRYVHLAEKRITLFERKITMKGLIFVYFQCGFWILHLKNYLDTKCHGQVISTWVIIKNALLRELLRAFLRWKGPKIKYNPERQIISWNFFFPRLLPLISWFKLVLEFKMVWWDDLGDLACFDP